MRTRQRRKRKGEDDKEEDEEEKNSDEEVASLPASLLHQLGERVLHKHFGKHLLSVANLDGFDVALFVVAAAAIKNSIKKWKESHIPAKAEEDSGEAGEEGHVQHSPRARRQGPGARRRKTPRTGHAAYSDRPETAALLAGKIVATAFFEPSTRTRCSFETAAMRLGGQILSCSDMQSTSSVKKGETLEDTIRMLAAYADAVVLRHPEKGSADRAAAVLDTRVEAADTCCLINAGDGTGEHPTQALLDIFTIAELFPQWWSEQLQRLSKEQHAEGPHHEKGNTEEQEEVKKENKGQEPQQEKEGQATDSHSQRQTSSHPKEEGSAGSGESQTPTAPPKMAETSAEGSAADPAAAAQSSSSTHNETDKEASAADTKKKAAEPGKLTVAFVGDLKHGRTVHSLALLLSKFDCRIITLNSSDLALPSAVEDSVKTNFGAQGDNGGERLTRGSNFPETIGAADVVYMTRTQTERFVEPKGEDSLAKQSYNSFRLTRALLETHAKPHVKVLHPLPRVDEIDTAVDATPFCAYFTQAENGVYMRMALLAIALNPSTWHLLFGG